MNIQSLENVVQLREADLPAYCPHPNMPLWSSHPRVYLDLTHHSVAPCPYCGTKYALLPQPETV